ncbi:MAG: DUF3592 domain-containing protein [Pseudomonadota bacterium]
MSKLLFGLPAVILLLIGLGVIWLGLSQMSKTSALAERGMRATATVIDKESTTSERLTRNNVTGRSEYVTHYWAIMEYTPVGHETQQIRGQLDEETYANLENGWQFDIIYLADDPQSFDWAVERGSGPLIAFVIFGGILCAIGLGLGYLGFIAKP